jgi:GTP cyclohydrolase I/GTP cyclohydrolase-4
VSKQPHLVSDMQASTPPVELALSRAGVTGVQKAIRIRRGDAETVMSAEIECTVDLARGQKGVHMSRFPEVFDEAIGDVVLGEARIVEEIAEVIARHIVERQRAVRAEVRITARWPMRRMTPVTGLPTQEMVSLIGIAAATEHGARRVVGVEATGINACPCAQGLVAGRAAERLADAGFDAPSIEQILELVPIATHNQRGRGTLLVGTANHIDAETLVDLVERSMSAPVFELLKRPDELWVVEHAHLQPRFVEDSVRVALKGLLDEVPALTDDDFVFSRQVNLETIHDHDVLAERWGTVGELRSEMTGTDGERQTTLADWLNS